ncbi:tRNA preQ1(34) S-adenosylmethionine ribosyltransferase-isomerase QueA [Patescibacteria group bacterium]|nr:tRNA preQ1(34) S-adenosylmethionine ribosyltransferase-isomerase QueA [Patescibacteria group bacterium]MBU1933953.1 tRNA preQ1(34) S-adenosylmethionine ribosyltransferase-isomerase QueA [Patescibacteria group bacterium]
MRLKLFDYNLPKNLIAQKPISPRDHSRLLLLDKHTEEIEHKHFYDIVDYLHAGDVLVVNNTKVIAARLIGKRADPPTGGGGRVEVFLLKIQSPQPPFIKGGGEVWQCLVGGHKRKENLKVEFTQRLKAEIIKNNNDGTWLVKFNKKGAGFMKIVQKIGRVPLPSYVKRQDSTRFAGVSRLDSARLAARRVASLQNDIRNYQTVYADDKKIGSVAAPTAGFHFTPALLKKLKNKGVQIEYVTLQVGLGTFAPVKVEDITKHKMHLEWIEVDKKTLANIIKAKSEGRRIIAAGTTSVRTLESAFKQKPEKNYAAWTDIFIYPGYKFKIVDAMITNFHLPKSTLLMLISAFVGREKIFKAYKQAIKKKYRFFSYGDAMLIV